MMEKKIVRKMGMEIIRMGMVTGMGALMGVLMVEECRKKKK